MPRWRNRILAEMARAEGYAQMAALVAEAASPPPEKPPTHNVTRNTWRCRLCEGEWFGCEHGGHVVMVPVEAWRDRFVMPARVVRA